MSKEMHWPHGRRLTRFKIAPLFIRSPHHISVLPYHHLLLILGPLSWRMATSNTQRIMHVVGFGRNEKCEVNLHPIMVPGIVQQPPG